MSKKLQAGQRYGRTERADVDCPVGTVAEVIEVHPDGRDCSMRNVSTGRMLCRGQMVWCPLDLPEWWAPLPAAAEQAEAPPWECDMCKAGGVACPPYHEKPTPLPTPTRRMTITGTGTGTISAPPLPVPPPPRCAPGCTPAQPCRGVTCPEHREEMTGYNMVMDDKRSLCGAPDPNSAAAGCMEVVGHDGPCSFYDPPAREPRIGALSWGAGAAVFGGWNGRVPR